MADSHRDLLWPSGSRLNLALVSNGVFAAGGFFQKIVIVRDFVALGRMYFGHFYSEQFNSMGRAHSTRSPVSSLTLCQYSKHT
jgi:hypothetical protein